MSILAPIAPFASRTAARICAAGGEDPRQDTAPELRKTIRLVSFVAPSIMSVLPPSAVGNSIVSRSNHAHSQVFPEISLSAIARLFTDSPSMLTIVKVTVGSGFAVSNVRRPNDCFSL